MPCVPFANVMKRDIHFQRHGREFGAATAVEYELMADAFMFGPTNADTRECIRPNARRRNRMDFRRVYFGVAAIAQPVLATFYIPTPDTVRRHGGVIQLFADYCARTD